MFYLTSREPTIACMGTFPTVAAARDYAFSLRVLGLCTSFAVYDIEQGKNVYESELGEPEDMPAGECPFRDSWWI